MIPQWLHCCSGVPTVFCQEQPNSVGRELARLRPGQFPSFLAMPRIIGANNMVNNELVTAVMITGKSPKHEPLAWASIASFNLQTYPNKQLLIVNDGDYRFKNLPEGVRELRVSPGRTLGELRNVGLRHVREGWIMQWDDDDWHHPLCMEHMMKHRQTGKAVVLLNQIRYSFVSDAAISLKYGAQNGGIPGTILHPMTPVRYQKERRHEDSKFMAQAFPKNKRIVVINSASSKPFGTGPEAYIRFHHGGNTWNEKHIMRHGYWKPGQWRVSDEQAKYLREVIDTYYVFAGKLSVADQLKILREKEYSRVMLQGRHRNA